MHFITLIFIALKRNFSFTNLLKFTRLYCNMYKSHKEYMRYLLLVFLSISIIGCSDKKSKPLYLGDRLLSLAEEGVDGKMYAPKLSAVESALPECKFVQVGDFYKANCLIENASPNHVAKAEELNVILNDSIPNVNVIRIYKNAMDQNGGLSIFGKLKDVKIEEVSCPDIEINNNPMDNINFYRISKKNKVIGVYRESRSSGSGGASIESTLFYGLSSPPCQWSIENDTKLNKTMQSSAVDIPSNGSKGSSCGDDVSSMRQCLIDNKSLVNKYENLFFISLSDEAEPYLNEFLSIGNDCQALLNKMDAVNNEILFAWENYRNDGVNEIFSRISSKCGNRSDTPAGRYPMSSCRNLKDGNIKNPGSQLYFSDDTLNHGVVVATWGGGCTSWDRITREKGIHYTRESMSSEGCNDKMDAVHGSINSGVLNKRKNPILICSFK